MSPCKYDTFRAVTSLYNLFINYLSGMFLPVTVFVDELKLLAQIDFILTQHFYSRMFIGF